VTTHSLPLLENLKGRRKTISVGCDAVLREDKTIQFGFATSRDVT
jgi:hypothetical protein